MTNQINQKIISRDRVLQILNTTLIETELKMTLENNNEMHYFANTVFNQMLNKLAREELDVLTS